MDIEEAGEVQPRLEPDWRQPYIDCLARCILPTDQTEAHRLALRAKSFVLVGGELYRKSATRVLQWCIPIERGKELQDDVHRGVCGHHATPKSLVGSAFRQGFYWPTAVADATELVRTCEGCQFFAKQTHLPAQALQTIPVTRPFAVWGLDMVGPLDKAPRGYTHLFVMVDKFTKWIEVRPLTNTKPVKP